MKSYRVNFEAIVSFTALLEAWHAYRTNKRQRASVAAFELDLEPQLLSLSDALLSGRYRPGVYDLLRVRDPKPRLIAVAPVRDRVVHTALHNALAPAINRRFIRDTYACLPGRGSHRAILRFLHFVRRYPFVLHLDVRRFFPSVEHDRLRRLLEPRIRDQRTLGLINTLLASGEALYRRPEVRGFFGLPPWSPDNPARGLPIGNLTSQWWGNLYLDGLDHFIKRTLKVNGYVRYLDDIVLFGENRPILRAQRTAVREWLRTERGLELNPRKGHIRPTYLPQYYLGYRITARGVDLQRKTFLRFQRQLPALLASDPEYFQRAWAAWHAVITF